MAKPIVRVRVATKQKGDVTLRDLAQQVGRLGSEYVAVGILEPQRKYPDSDVSLGQVALWQEFGTHTAGGTPIVPARSFLRNPMDEGLPGIEALRARTLDQVLAGRLTVAKGLAILGADVVRRMQNAIKKRIDPPLRPATLRARRKRNITGTIPLLATQFLYNSIHFAVRRVGLADVLSGGKE